VLLVAIFAVGPRRSLRRLVEGPKCVSIFMRYSVAYSFRLEDVNPEALRSRRGGMGFARNADHGPRQPLSRPSAQKVSPQSHDQTSWLHDCSAAQLQPEWYFGRFDRCSVIRVLQRTVPVGQI